MEIFLIIISIVLLILLIGVCIYLLALYCHRNFSLFSKHILADDSGFGAGYFCKVLVVLGLSLSWLQVLLMPLDVANSKYSNNFNSLILGA